MRILLYSGSVGGEYGSRPHINTATDDFVKQLVDDYRAGQTSTGFITNWEADDKPKLPAKPPKDVFMIFNSNDWVFTQATAVASVNVEPDREWQITPDSVPYVNFNSNSWETNYLLSCYKTFKGAMNLKDHVAPEDGGKIYGMIIDAVPRRIHITKDESVLYIDTIIATNKHIDPQWADAIRRGTIRFLSVGFNCNYLTCSQCGHVYSIDGVGICQHCLYDTGLSFYDEFGRKSVTSAMCANVEGVDNTGEFVELSYLSVNPAFTGATKAFTLAPPANTDIKIRMEGLALYKPAYKALKEYIKIQRIPDVVAKRR